LSILRIIYSCNKSLQHYPEVSSSI